MLRNAVRYGLVPTHVPVPSDLNGLLTCKRNPRQPLHGTGDRKDHGNDHANDTKDDRAGAMLSDSVHHDPKGQDMASHDEDKKQKLTQAEDLPANRAHQDFSGIPKVLDLRISLSK